MNLTLLIPPPHLNNSCINSKLGFQMHGRLFVPRSRSNLLCRTIESIIMKRNSTSGTYTSPNTPDYNDDGNIQRGWYSERVPIPNSSRRHIIATTFMPFNSARALPSKWDDAERWITSPLSIHGVSTPVIAQRKNKSKSGPLEICRAAYLASYLPPVPMLEGEIGTIEAERSDDDKSSSHVPGWAELMVESSLSNVQERRRLSFVVSEQIDMATQMSRVGSTRSYSFFTKSRSGLVKDDLRDVEMDQGHSMDVDESAEASQINILKMQREESKINAWENLQKAKAEVAIQKLEVKLENERSASVEKIIKKLRIAEIKAEEARRLLLSESCGNVTQKKSRLCFDVYKKMDYVWSWFACHDA